MHFPDLIPAVKGIPIFIPLPLLVQDNSHSMVTCTSSLCSVAPPTIRRDVVEYTTVVDSPVQMSCDATGLPVPVVTWYQDGVELGGVDSVEVLSSGALRLDRATVNDSGLYECRAVNEAGAASRIVRLTVHGRSVVHLHLQT